MSLNLKKLETKLNEQLEKETPESLRMFLNEANLKEEDWEPIAPPNLMLKISICPKCKGVGRTSEKHKDCSICHGSGIKTEI